MPCVGRTANTHASVYILDCIWELFVLVGGDARGKRDDIRLALSVADVSIFFRLNLSRADILFRRSCPL